MTLDLDSGASEPTLPPGYDGGCADWSPDGRSIAFSSWPDFLYPPRDTEPWESPSVFRPDGSDLRRPTSNDVFDGHPVWQVEERLLRAHSGV